MNTLSILKANQHLGSRARGINMPRSDENIALSHRQLAWSRYAESRKAALAPTPTPPSTAAGTSTELARAELAHGTARAMSGRWDYYGANDA